MSESISRLRALLHHMADSGSGPASAPRLAALGPPAIDQALGGGLALARLHEIYAAEAQDAASAAGFAAMLAMLAMRLAPIGQPIVWLREDRTQLRDGRLHAPGLAAIGLDPARLILAVLPDAATLLRAAAELLRCPDCAVVVIELWQSPRLLDLTASRRLGIAAEASGATALLLRAEATPAPSAAQTRWQVAAAASTPLEADAPGFPALDIALLRQRGRPAGFRWRVEWDRDHGLFREPGHEPPLPRVVVPLATGRSTGEPWRRAG